MNRFRRNTGLPTIFRRRLRRRIEEHRDLTEEQRLALLDRIYDEAFLDEVGNQAIVLYGEPATGFVDWLKKVDWLTVISIALTLLSLFLAEEQA